MSTSLTFSIQELEYEDLNKEIKRTMHRSAKDVVQIGFMLRQMAEKKIWAAAYDCFDEYLVQELHLNYSMATRFMNINRKYSDSGNSMEIAKKYEGYSQGLLIEMLNMPQELEEKVSPDMTVKQVREIKKQARQEREALPDDSIPGTSLEKDFPEYMPEPGISTDEEPDSSVIDGEYREIKEPEEEKVATSQPEENRAHDEAWFAEQYANIMHGETAELFEICRKEQNNSDRAKAIQRHIAPYGYSNRSCSEYDFTFHGFSGGIDFCIGSEKMHIKYGRFAAELMNLLEKESVIPRQEVKADEREKVATSQPEENSRREKLSPYGLPKTVYPEGSLIAAAGCDHKHSCFDYAQDCEIRQEDSYCVEAPFGNPFPCTTMHVLENIRSEIGGQCPFINQDTAGHATPCCKKCGNTSCGYRCTRSKALNEAVPVDSAQEPKDDLTIAKDVLKQESKLLDDYLERGDLHEMTVRKQKTIVVALASMVCDLEIAEAEPELEEMTQPELPALKNNDQRKEWLNNYKDWGLWYRDENIDVNYYKYDFIDGSRLIVSEYPQRHTYYSSEYEDEHYYHLLEKNKKGYRKPYDEQYRQQTDSETYLVEFLKSLQKKVSIDKAGRQE